MFRVFTTKEFDDNFRKLDESSKKAVRKIMGQLREQGGDIGKPLQVPYFREKRVEDKRVYFLIYKNYKIVLAIAIGDKKTQQKTINKILSEINNYKEEIVKRLKETL